MYELGMKRGSGHDSFETAFHGRMAGSTLWEGNWQGECTHRADGRFGLEYGYMAYSAYTTLKMKALFEQSITEHEELYWLDW